MDASPAHIPVSPVWTMLADRWRKTMKAKALSANTERSYLYTASRWTGPRPPH